MYKLLCRRFCTSWAQDNMEEAGRWWRSWGTGLSVSHVWLCVGRCSTALPWSRIQWQQYPSLGLLKIFFTAMTGLLLKIGLTGSNAGKVGQ